MLSELRTSLDIDINQGSRLPQRRGTESKPKSTEVVHWSNKNINHAIENVSNVLLPGIVGEKISDASHIVVVPALDISTTPFALLRPPGQGAHLIDRAAITVAPSLYELGDGGRSWFGESAGKGSKSSPIGKALIVGNPKYFPDAKWYFPQLPGAEREAQRAAHLLGTVPLLGSAATKREIIPMAKEASVLYLATHGVASEIEPLKSSFLALSGNSIEESRWTALEIQKTRFKAKLAVLSACQTGLGQVNDAGVIGLARGFQISGVPRVLMSLWNVDDDSTAALMDAFVSELRSNYPSEALRNAILTTRKEYDHPAHWAAFAHFGTIY